MAAERDWAYVWLEELTDERENCFGWFKAYPGPNSYYDPELMVRVLGNDLVRQEAEKCRRQTRQRSGNGS